jgi:endoglucanase
MRRTILSLLCLALFCASLAQPVKIHGRLRVEGTQLVDEKGYAYALHGMSLGWSCYWPRFYNAGTIDCCIRTGIGRWCGRRWQ